MQKMVRAEELGRFHPAVDAGMADECWMNNKYEVTVIRDIKPGDPYGPPEGSDFPPVTYLSIKRRGDKSCVRDWRHLQEIKNDICGPEAEGVEIYPAESRKVDTANQFHLWVLMPPNGFPFGYSERAVSGAEEAKKEGAVQRPFRHADRYCEEDSPERLEATRKHDEEVQRKAGLGRGMTDEELAEGAKQDHQCRKCGEDCDVGLKVREETDPDGHKHTTPIMYVSECCKAETTERKVG